MWLDKEVSIGKAKHSAKVNVSDSLIEVELPFVDEWLSGLNESIDVDGKSYNRNNVKSVGDRDESIMIILKTEVKNEPKRNESRKKSFNK